jgi:hypothetical protein
LVDCCFSHHRPFSLSIGNWDPKTQDARYSAKMPIPAIRGMAGYDPSDLHWVPRAQVVPCEALQLQVFPFIETVLEELHSATVRDNHDRSTAVATMRLWKYLRVVVLQDAAAMLAERPERGGHRLMRLPVFKSQGFLVSKRFVVVCFV